ncbi:MAG: chemotaxis response regulator protein-glutamate methylesterase [Polyangiales bacterium]
MSTGKVRVMIVDDSAVVRRLLAQALSGHPEIEIVGTAANGAIALSKIASLNPEAIILDIEMPEMDGITMLGHLRETHPRLPVIMFSTLTERGASVTFDALAAGASDYVLKPSTQHGESLEGVVRNTLVPKLIALTRSRFALATQAALAQLEPIKNPFAAPPITASLRAPAPKLRPSMPTTPAKRSMVPIARKPVRVIGIAASTGGPNALAAVIERLPAQLPVPIVIVQHMPPIFTRTLAERLAARAALKVRESEGGELLEPGCVYIAPGNRHMEAVREGEQVRLTLHDGPPENSVRPSADVLFRSLNQSYAGGVLAVVLTGMGQDGVRGARELAQAGGRVLAQSGPTCVVWGMPKAVEEAGIADAIVPLPEMASAILQRVGTGLLPTRRPEGER